MNRIGSLCTGYGGLDMAVENILGGEMVWYSEFDQHPSTLLAQRFPGVPNLGDLKLIDWASLPAIDILTGGYPCQPFSEAGKRLGEDDPRHLWPYIRKAIRTLRPRLTILENVRGHRSNGFSTVLRDCAEDGLDVQWVTVRASDAGAPHERERLFFAVTSNAQGAYPRRLPVREAPQEPRPGGSQVSLPSWGDYGPAVHRWESVLGRTAPEPTEPNKNGSPRLAVRFVEWMMGLPNGWVGDVDIPYGAKLKLLGNGVVPQQAEIAIRHLTNHGDGDALV